MESFVKPGGWEKVELKLGCVKCEFCGESSFRETCGTYPVYIDPKCEAEVTPYNEKLQTLDFHFKGSKEIIKKFARIKKKLILTRGGRNHVYPVFSHEEVAIPKEVEYGLYKNPGFDHDLEVIRSMDRDIDEWDVYTMGQRESGYQYSSDITPNPKFVTERPYDGEEGLLKKWKKEVQIPTGLYKFKISLLSIDLERNKEIVHDFFQRIKEYIK